MTRALAGPYATMLLADLGADVIKVEPPNGDMTRVQGPYRADDDERVLGGYFQSVNRGKRSVVADLATSEGTGLVRRLAAHADVLMENFRAGVMDRMGLSYETLSADNPRLVYGALRGFGDPRTGAGPYVDRPAYDVVAQAMGGLMAITGAPDGPPTKVGPGVGDIFPAALTVVGVLAAVHEARSTGRGRFVDVSMYDAMISLCERSVYQYSVLGQVAGQVGNDHPIFCPFGVYRAADGWVTVAAPGDRHWERLAEVIGRPELAADPRFATNAERAARRDEVRAVIEAWTGVRARDVVVAELSGSVPCGPVNTADAIFADPHVAARNMLIDVEQPGSATPVTIAGQPIKFAGHPEPAYRRGPLLGEHTAEVLEEFGIPAPRPPVGEQSH
ncbi:MAG: CoA transferase [Streptosporangiales bacterium]|nr:CoA transferase [Streptosporangiales bacterium]